MTSTKNNASESGTIQDLINNTSEPGTIQDLIIQDRINNTKELIASNPQIQQFMEENKMLWKTIKTYDLTKLVKEIQPRINNDSLSEHESGVLVLLMLEYQLRGCDLAYFQCGSGARGGCVIF